MAVSKLSPVPILNYSGFEPDSVPIIDEENYRVRDDMNISGDAPKDFIEVYDDSRKEWVAYVAKVGHKWYPNESITEYLLNRIGETLGFRVAASRLVRIGSQIRFLSEYFLAKGQQLVHGAELYTEYLSDRALVEEVERKGLARDLFTVQFTQAAVAKAFPAEQEAIMESFRQMLLYDALVGNNDRHFYNWGVVQQLNGEQPYFAPVYDTARGLFWNNAEEKVVSLASNGDQRWLDKYVNNSRPKIGWEGITNPNHLQLIRVMVEQESVRHSFRAWLDTDRFADCLRIIDTEFSTLLSEARLKIVKDCLRRRFEILIETIQ
ncbi:MAG: HipA domain-containing protein [Bacteroidota bacterium]